MSNEITVVTPKSLAELKDLSNIIAPSAMLPEAFRGKPGDVAVCVMTGAELGLLPMQSLRAIEMIKGKPSIKAEAQVALVRRSESCEYFRMVESTGKVATYETKRRGDPAPTRLSFSVEQAQAAGLTTNDTWRKFPDAMLRARCSSALCKIAYSDLLLGVYDPEEISEPYVPTAPARKLERIIEDVATKPPQQTDVEDASFVPVGPAALVDTTAESQPELVDPIIVAIHAAKSADELRAAAAKTGKILDAGRKAVVGAAYNAKMTELRGGK